MNGYDDGPWNPAGPNQDEWRPQSRSGRPAEGDSGRSAGLPGEWEPYDAAGGRARRPAAERPPAGRRRAGEPAPPGRGGYPDRDPSRDPSRGPGRDPGRDPRVGPGQYPDQYGEPDPADRPPKRRGDGGTGSRNSARSDGAKGRKQRKKWSWKKKTLVWTAGTTAFLMLVGGSVVGYLYLHFNANIKSTSLLPPGVTQAAEIPNQFGQTPLNILVMGSDTRDTAADCSLGHDCPNSGPNASGPPHADVEMVVHLSADRTNMTVMSIPRDTIVQLPAGCAHGETNLINAALNFGPQCQVEEVGELTGLPIDGYVMADMGAVVGLSNAIGPVQVCVTNNVYDTYSGLQLPKGDSEVVGVQALQWLRSRHAFGDEVYREEAQHYFLSAMIRKLESEGSFSNVGTLYSVADVATKSLTVSQNLDSVMSLLSLAQEMGKVPTSRITMMTMPWEDYDGPNPAWRQSQLQVMQPQASQMFAALKADQPYTAAVAPATGSPSGGSTASPAATATGAPVNHAGVKVSVVNDNGTSGRALTVRDALVGAGFTQASDTNGSGDGTAQTMVYYPAGRSDSAAAVANALGIPAAQVKQSSIYSEVTVLIGKDWPSGASYGTSGGSSPSGGSTAPVIQASAPPADSYTNLASDANACMEVASPEWGN